MIALVLAMQLIAVQAPSPPPATPPETASPDFPAFQAIAEASIKDKMPDPDSAKFRWDPRTFALTGWSNVGVTYACGRLNGRNHLGGYTGYQRFWVGEKNGAVVLFDIDSDANDDENRTTDEAACHRWGRDQVTPLAPAPPTATP